MTHTASSPAPGNTPADTPKLLFLCYRREDTQDAAGRLHDRLVNAYGSDRVFMDIASVPLGIDFVDQVTEQIAQCSAVIVLIGKQWLTTRDKKRRRRLDNEDDLVRAEIRSALQQKIPVIPVVVQNVSMPHADDLPDDIRPLARRNGIHLRPEQWKEGVERLLRELDGVLGRRRGAGPSPRPHQRSRSTAEPSGTVLPSLVGVWTGIRPTATFGSSTSSWT